MNKNINEYKNDYEKIEASEEFKSKIKNEIKKSNDKKNLKAFIGLAASFVLCFGIVANISFKFAYAMSDVPGLDSFVKVVTFGKYENIDDGYEIKVEIPEIEGLLDEELQGELNEEFREIASSVILSFEESVRELKEEFGEDTVHMSIEFNYEIKADNENVLALDVYTYYASGSSNSVHNYFTIDRNSGSILTLKGLFKDDVDYITPISEYIRQEMLRRNSEEDGIFFLEDFDKISEEQKFYINNDGNIVICFAKYEIAAGAEGVPEFVIPNSLVEDLLR